MIAIDQGERRWLYGQLYLIDQLLEEAEQVQQTASGGKSQWFTTKTSVPGWLYDRIEEALKIHGVTEIRRSHLSANEALPRVHVVPLSPTLNTTQLMSGLYEAQARVLIQLRGPYPDDDSDDDDSDEAQTAI